MDTERGYRPVGGIQGGGIQDGMGIQAEGDTGRGRGYRPGEGIQAGGIQAERGGGGSWDKQTPTVETKCLFGNQTNG